MSAATRTTADAPAPLVALLAAGLARRFGGGKLDARCAGRRLGAWPLAAVAAAGLPPGVIVTGPQAPAFVADAEGWRTLVNPAPEGGLGGSLALAAAEALRQRRSLLVLLADMPLIPAAHLAALAAGAPAATPYPDGRAGVPAHLPLAALDRVAQGAGEGGAAAWLRGLDGVHLPDLAAHFLADVDTPAELGRVAAALEAHGREA